MMRWCRAALLQPEGHALLHRIVAAAQRGNGDVAAVGQGLVGALLVAARLAAVEDAILERLREHALLAPAVYFAARGVEHGEVVFLAARELELEILLGGVGEVEREVDRARFGSHDERTLEGRGGSRRARVLGFCDLRRDDGDRHRGWCSRLPHALVALTRRRIGMRA